MVNFVEVWRAHLAKSTLLTSTLGPLGSFKICSGVKEKVGWEATTPINTQ